MVEVASWEVLNFFTAFLLVLLLIFQSNTSRLQKGRRYSAILVCTLILMIAETIGRIGELNPDKYLFLARIGYFVIFLLDPLDVLFAINYVDCWMDEGNQKNRHAYRLIFEIFAFGNMILVGISTLFDLNWFYYFKDGLYFRGEFFLVRAGFIMLSIVLLVAYTIIFRKNIMSDYKNLVLFLPYFAFVGAVLQVVFVNMDTTYAGIALGCLIVFFFFQSKDVNVDYLTGVLNRRGLDIKMADMIKNSAASGKDFSAIMLDIDYFKEINDTFGHAAGDKAIKDVANILVDTFGQQSYIGRFGGDEFCVISDMTDERSIKEKIDGVHTSMSRMRKRYGWPREVDVSCGHMIFKHDCGLSTKEFQHEIDRLMYEEKEKHHSRN